MADEYRRISSLPATDRRMVESAPTETDDTDSARQADGVESENFDIETDEWSDSEGFGTVSLQNPFGAGRRSFKRSSYLRLSSQTKTDAARQAGGLPGMNAGLPQGRTPQDVQSPDSDAWVGALQPNLD